MRLQDPRDYRRSNCICPDCGNIFPIPRKKYRQRERGHIKTLWCPFCKREQDMQEIRSMDFIKIE